MTLAATETTFGRLVGGHNVEGWVIDVLRKWSSTYLGELERQNGYAACSLPRIRGWALGPTFDKWPEDQLPGLLVVSPGLVPPPTKDGYGTYRARWRVDVGCCCSASTQALSHELAQLYIAAHKAVIVQRPSLELHADGVTWLDESYDPLPYDDTRSLYAGYASFAIEVDDVVTTYAGPVTPSEPDDPCAPWPLDPTVETYDVDVNKVDAIPKEEE